MRPRGCWARPRPCGGAFHPCRLPVAAPFQGTPCWACGAIAIELLTPSSNPPGLRGTFDPDDNNPALSNHHTVATRETVTTAPTVDRMSLQVPMHPKAAGAGKDTKAVILVSTERRSPPSHPIASRRVARRWSHPCPSRRGAALPPPPRYLPRALQSVRSC